MAMFKFKGGSVTSYLVTDLEDSRSFALRSGKLPDDIFTLKEYPRTPRDIKRNN
jgi:hypothetical protein